VSQAVTIIIPHYRAETLPACLQSLFDNSDVPLEVIVVDNGPDSPSMRQAQRDYPQIQIVRNERNLGFCIACNQGLERARTPYAVLLNDDTRVTPGWLGPLISQADADPQIAALQPKLLAAAEPDTFDYAGACGGYIDRLGFTFCRGRMFNHREQDNGQYDAAVPLFWACGSAMFLRLEAVRQVGLLDADFFMHFEEIDLCWRLQLAAYHVASVPTSVVYHHSGWSLPPNTFAKTYLNHRNNLVMICKNMAGRRLAWVLPIRFGLDVLAVWRYILKREWLNSVAPLAAFLWILGHLGGVWRRRQQSQQVRRVSDASLQRGVYCGSLVYQHFVRGVRHASQLIVEEREQ
jgi:GT2 family glycosyltransferase